MYLDLKKISGWFHANKVTVNPAKYSLLVFSTNLKLTTPNINIFLNNLPIP